MTVWGYTGPTVDDTFPNGKRARDMSDAEIAQTARGYADHFIHVQTGTECGERCETDWCYYDADIMPVVAEMFARGMIRVT